MSRIRGYGNLKKKKNTAAHFRSIPFALPMPELDAELAAMAARGDVPGFRR